MTGELEGGGVLGLVYTEEGTEGMNEWSINIPYSGKFPQDKIFADSSKNENLQIRFSADAGQSHATEQRERLVRG